MEKKKIKINDSDENKINSLFDYVKNLTEKKFGKKHYFEEGSAGGLYDPSCYTITLKSDLPDSVAKFVLIHEGIHHRLGLLNYGEAIRRLNTLGINLFIPLNIIRVEYCDSSLDEMLGRKHKLHEKSYMLSNQKLLDKIREKMVNNKDFMRGVKFLNKVEQKRIILCSEWDVCQEGFAYWLSFRLFLEDVREKGDSETENEILTTMERIKDLPKQIQEGIKMVKDLNTNWGFEKTIECQYLCVNPSFDGLPILDSSVDEFFDKVHLTRYSPNFRLKKLVEISSNQPFTCFQDLYRYFYPDYKDHKTQLIKFLRYWEENVFKHQESEKILNRLYGTEKSNWNPHRFDVRNKDTLANEPIDPSIKFDNEGVISMVESYPDINPEEPISRDQIDEMNDWLEQMSLFKSSFLNMARREGLI